jgi:DNA invertase Pin-like site-specific DNA recombinase
MPRSKRPTRNAAEPTIAVGYVRVSTAEQHASGAGLEDQRRAVRDECERRGWKLLRTYEDANGASGRNLRRPALQEALQALSAGRAHVLVTSKLDRLSRSVIDFATLMQQAEREHWSIVVLDVAVDTSTPSGEMMANVVAAFAQYERRLISERTKRALAVKQAEGRRDDCPDCERSVGACRTHASVKLGRPRTVPDEVRNYIASLRAQGLSLRAIAATLTDERVPTGQGGARWYASVVRAVLERDA